jgi:uncharacterized protein (TIGR01777 family)
MRVFVTGGTGLVGTRLVRRLLGRGDQLVVLTRRYGAARQALGPGVELIEGDPMQAGPWMDKIDDCDAVVHLAGENVFARRWGKAFKQMLFDSRVQSTRNVAQAIVRKPQRPDGQAKVLVNASAIGYYGPHGDEEITEESPPGTDFLARLCVEWEEAAKSVESAGVRSTELRVGVVLDKEGGALAKMLPPFKLFAGGPVGSGKQWLSWIHHEDLVGLFVAALDTPDYRGAVNGAAPNPVTNKEFAKALGRALHRPAFVWTPGLALRVLLGEAANVITTGQRVLPRKALSLGFSFQYPTIDAALAEIFSSTPQGSPNTPRVGVS